jgi:hypothetical protein
MNNILKALLGSKLPNPSVSKTSPVLIEINPKPPRKPRQNTVKKQSNVKNSEDVITEKEIQIAMKRIKKIEAEARKRLAEEELKELKPVTKNENKKETTKKKKQPIPSHVKTLIWNHWIGHDKAEAFCLCCKVTKISIRSFHAGHIIAESKGGDMTVKNLKPICGPCNHSMGAMNMDEFIKKFGLGK